MLLTLDLSDWATAFFIIDNPIAYWFCSLIKCNSNIIYFIKLMQNNDIINQISNLQNESPNNDINNQIEYDDFIPDKEELNEIDDGKPLFN